MDEKGEKKEDKEYYKARTLFLFRGTQEVDSDRVGHELLKEVLEGVPSWEEGGPPPKYLFQLLLIVVEDPESLMVDMTQDDRTPKCRTPKICRSRAPREKVLEGLKAPCVLHCQIWQ